MSPRLIGIVLGAMLAVGCKNNVAGSDAPPPKIEAERRAFISDNEAAIHDAFVGFAKCKEEPYVAGKGSYSDACLSEIATAFGSKSGMVVTPPDDAAAATAALILVRDGRGDALTHADTWLVALKSAKGPGQDALRLAVAKKMLDAAPVVGREIEGDVDSRAALKAIVGAVPGACNTYYLVGNGARLEGMPPPLTPDKSACVTKDIGRGSGSVSLHGTGISRALDGAIALWRETEKALRAGSTITDPSARAALTSKLDQIEAATQKIVTHADEATIKALEASVKDGGLSRLRPTPQRPTQTPLEPGLPTP